MRRQIVFDRVGVELGLSPARERIELHFSFGDLDHRQSKP
jgi:hypothetical protein